MTGASVSLVGYIAGPNETGFEHLFAGDTVAPAAEECDGPVATGVLMPIGAQR